MPTLTIIIDDIAPEDIEIVKEAIDEIGLLYIAQVSS